MSRLDWRRPRIEKLMKAAAAEDRLEEILREIDEGRQRGLSEGPNERQPSPLGQLSRLELGGKAPAEGLASLLPSLSVEQQVIAWVGQRKCLVLIDRTEEGYQLCVRNAPSMSQPQRALLGLSDQRRSRHDSGSRVLVGDWAEGAATTHRLRWLLEVLYGRAGQRSVTFFVRGSRGSPQT